LAVCPRCKAINLETAVRCKWCSLPLAKPKPQEEEQDQQLGLQPMAAKPQPPTVQQAQLPVKPAQPMPLARSEPTAAKLTEQNRPIEQVKSQPREPQIKPAGAAPYQGERRTPPPVVQGRTAQASIPVGLRRTAPAPNVMRPATPTAPAQPKPSIVAAPAQDDHTHYRRLTKPSILEEPIIARSPPPRSVAKPITPPARAATPLPQQRQKPLSMSKPLPPPPPDFSQRSFDLKIKMVMRCPGCGKKLEDGKFCKHCGTKLG